MEEIVALLSSGTGRIHVNSPIFSSPESCNQEKIGKEDLSPALTFEGIEPQLMVSAVTPGMFGYDNRSINQEI